MVVVEVQGVMRAGGDITPSTFRSDKITQASRCDNLCIIHDQMSRRGVTPVRRPYRTLPTVCPEPPPLTLSAMALLDATNGGDNGAGRSLPPSPDAVIHGLQDLVSPSYLNHDLSLVHIRAGALFARLKAVNRAANVATRERKQATSDMRHNMDQTYLSLQNLLYEKRHLEREIEKCRQFA